MRLIRKVTELRATVDAWRKEGHRVALVPTMGALHAGHAALISRAAQSCDKTIVTIFVNPTQFGPHEDLDAYPRTMEEDQALIKAHGGDVIFAPDRAEIYPEGFATTVQVSGLSAVLCGQARPGHFNGVAQIVTKLLNQAQADAAFFGEKDWQQLAIIRRLASDLDFRTQILGVPTMRDAYGLALSSRNRYLSAEGLERAKGLNKILADLAEQIARGMEPVAACTEGTSALLALGFRAVDYLECRGERLLRLPKESASDEPLRLFVAAHLEKARLIDNWPIAPLHAGD